MIRRFIKRILTPPLVILAACVMFFEEWLWNRVTAVMARIGQLPLFQWIEERLAQLPPYGALAILILPGTLLLPIKLAALYFMAHGHAIAGVSVIVAAKVIGTAIVARMFAVCHDALMQIRWVKWLTEGIVRLKNWLYTRIKLMPGWNTAVRFKRHIGLWLRSFRKDGLRRRWLAIKRWLKRSQASDSVPPVAPTADNSDPL